MFDQLPDPSHAGVYAFDEDQFPIPAATTDAEWVEKVLRQRAGDHFVP